MRVSGGGGRMIEAMQQHLEHSDRFPSRQEVELESSLATQHDCDHCGEKLESNAALREHQATRHQGARAWTCPDCAKSFATSSGLKQHQHIHSSVKPFQCEVCLKAYTQFSNLCRHKRMHADCRQQIKCHECGQSFSTLHSLNKHKRFCEGVMRSGSRLALPAPGGYQGPMHGMMSPLSSPGSGMSPFGSPPPPSSVTNPHLAALQAAYLNMYTSGSSMPLYPSSSVGLYPGYGGIGKSSSAFTAPWKESLLRKPDDSENSDVNSMSEESLGESEPTTPKSDRALSPPKGTPSDEKPTPTPTPSFHHSKSSPFAEAKPSHGIEDILKISSNVTPIFNYSAMKRKQEMRNIPVAAEKPTSDEEDDRQTVEPKEEPERPKEIKEEPKPKPTEAPLDLTVKHRDEKEEIDDSRKTHIFGSTKVMKVSPMPAIPAPKPVLPLSPIKKKEEVTPEKKVVEPEPLRPTQLHSAYPVPNPMFMNHLYGLDREKISQIYGFDREKLQAYQSMANMASMMRLGHQGNGMYPMMHQPTPVSSMDTSPRLLPPTYIDRAAHSHPHISPPYQSFNPGYTRTKDKYVCKFCGKNFPRSANLTRHLRTHTGEQPYKCKYCERSFSISSNLQRHIRNIHNKEKPYQCQLCERSFGQQTNLDRHMKSHEPEPLPTMVPPSEEFRYTFGALDGSSGALVERFPFTTIRKELHKTPEDEEEDMDEDGFQASSESLEENGCNADDESSDEDLLGKENLEEEGKSLSDSKPKDFSAAMDVNFSITAQIGKQKAMDQDKTAELVLSH